MKASFHLPLMFPHSLQANKCGPPVALVIPWFYKTAGFRDAIQEMLAMLMNKGVQLNDLCRPLGSPLHYLIWIKPTYHYFRQRILWTIGFLQEKGVCGFIEKGHVMEGQFGRGQCLRMIGYHVLTLIYLSMRRCKSTVPAVGFEMVGNGGANGSHGEDESRTRRTEEMMSMSVDQGHQDLDGPNCECDCPEYGMSRPPSKMELDV
ncbi:uncharacterized protein Z519_07444 [Cladophialophora bantiana CBS 173.52]|uniref:Uncharacterized protein n=1 Tax=Cladophialophora bantiana (strain ATCC 10958 / CBS 173.52 / CDC B-1940 / NIH 8579) TaxID=1442370 RepID=A0A0D2HDW2_CLAB1|nr:uncharacterized protein Z519_07444 [Cladophialophora bantiana CBS 173.52]KIW91478.1 hypothetical protein Z519_07444 [Cladophialophora bantiana CBS 173.52]